jgi:hypothetical protein
VTLFEIADGLPNGFHDAEIWLVQVDYSRQILRLDMELWVGSMEDPPETREAYRRAVVTVSGLRFCSLALPDAEYTFADDTKITVDLVSSNQDLLPQELIAKANGGFIQTFFVYDWNSHIHVCGAAAELAWVSEISYR